MYSAFVYVEKSDVHVNCENMKDRPKFLAKSVFPSNDLHCKALYIMLS